jgi:predicted DNA-binding protein (MmcQ/YjbR family)
MIMPSLDPRTLQDYCRSLPGATQDIKWTDHLVFSVGGKMFAAFHAAEEGGGLPLGFKCDDIQFERLTRKKGIIPAPYAARFGWVSIRERSALTDAAARKLILASNRLVVEKLPRAVRAKVAGEGR